MPLRDERGRLLLTLREAAAATGVAAGTLRKAADSKRLRATKLGPGARAPWVTTLEDVRAYLSEQSTNARNARAGWETRRARRQDGPATPATEG